MDFSNDKNAYHFHFYEEFKYLSPLTKFKVFLIDYGLSKFHNTPPAQDSKDRGNWTYQAPESAY